jgi:hypothetical protein
MITEERNKFITHILTNIDNYISLRMNVNDKFTEEEMFHLRQIFGQIIRRHTVYGERETDRPKTT